MTIKNKKYGDILELDFDSSLGFYCTVTERGKEDGSFIILSPNDLKKIKKWIEENIK
jgi:hypothetical protein